MLSGKTVCGACPAAIYETGRLMWLSLRQRKDRTIYRVIEEYLMKLHSKTTVNDLMKEYPDALAVFIQRRLGCVGCPTEAFHTLEDVAQINGLELDRFLEELEQAVSLQKRPQTGYLVAERKPQEFG